MSTELARIPEPLQKIGVRFDEGDLIVPDEVRERFNVLLPVKRLGRSNDLFTPGVSGIKLDIRRHAYPQGKKAKNGPSPDDEFALSKDGLLALAEAAGLIGSGHGCGTRRMPRSELAESERGWQCTLGMRQADGTIRLLPTASRVIDLDVEKEKIELEVEAAVRRYAANDKLDTEEKIQARIAQRVRERWVKERPHFDSKAETMSVLRAVRAALQVPQKFTRAELQKPFLIATMNFTPDLSDPEVRRMLTAAALGAQASIYGSPSVAAIESSVDDAPLEPAAGDPQPAAEPFDGNEPGGPDAAEEVHGDVYQPQDDERDASTARAKRAADVVVGFGKHKGKTIGDIGRLGADGADYVRWVSEAANDAGVKQAACDWHAHLVEYGELA